MKNIAMILKLCLTVGNDIQEATLKRLSQPEYQEAMTGLVMEFFKGLKDSQIADEVVRASAIAHKSLQLKNDFFAKLKQVALVEAGIFEKDVDARSLKLGVDPETGERWGTVIPEEAL